MEFVPRHLAMHLLAPARLPGGAVVRRLGPLSPQTIALPVERHHRATARHTIPGPTSPAACRVSASCRECPSPYGRWRTATRDDAGTHEPLPAKRDTVPDARRPLGTHGLPVQGWWGRQRQLSQRRAADGQGRGGRRMIRPVARGTPLGHRDMEEPPLQKGRHGQRPPWGEGGPRVGLLLPRTRGEGDAVAVVRHEAGVLERATPQIAGRYVTPGPVGIAFHEVDIPARLRRMAETVEKIKNR